MDEFGSLRYTLPTPYPSLAYLLWVREEMAFSPLSLPSSLVLHHFTYSPLPYLVKSLSQFDVCVPEVPSNFQKTGGS